MKPSCNDCIFFLKAAKPEWPHICKRARTSAIWERASKLPAFTKGGVGHHIYTPITDNCGYEGQFFEAKERDEKTNFKTIEGHFDRIVS